MDILINNAGFGDCGNFTKTKLEKEMQDSYSDYVYVQSQLVNDLAKVIATKVSK